MRTFFELGQFTEITSWNDIVGRFKYTPEIDPKSTKVEEIIAAYVLKDEDVRCGLKDCHSPHDKGFLVRTSDGNEANIGWICGSKYFGTDFNTLRNQYLRADRIRTHKRKLNEVLAQQDQYFTRIAELKKAEHGADWLYWSLQRFKGAYPKPIVAELEERARRDVDVVEVTRERTNQEIELAIPRTRARTARACVTRRRLWDGCGVFTSSSATFATYSSLSLRASSTS